MTDQVSLNNILPQAMSNSYAVMSTEALPREIFLRENPERYLRLERVVMASVVAVPVMKDGSVIGFLIGMVLLDGYDWLPNLIHDGSGDGARLFGALVQESRVVASSRRPGNFWSDGQLLPSEVSDVVLKGKTFSGPATVNNEPCFISAEPILNAQKRVIGSMVVGSKAGAIDAFIRGRGWGTRRTAPASQSRCATRCAPRRAAGRSAAATSWSSCAARAPAYQIFSRSALV